jgi:translation elongation factor EF-4
MNHIRNFSIIAHKKKGRVEWRRALNQQSLATAMAGPAL